LLLLLLLLLVGLLLPLGGRAASRHKLNSICREKASQSSSGPEEPEETAESVS